MSDISGSRLDLTLLGPPSLRVDGAPVGLPTQKSLALACLLAARREPVTRAELAELLWGPGRARNVRQALYTLRQLPGGDGFIEGGDPVSLVADSDLARVEAALARGDAAVALGELRGAFLEGLEVRGAPAFMDWVAEMRTRVERIRHEALARRAVELEAEGRTGEAREAVRRILQIDTVDEVAHRAAIRLAFLEGDREGALAAYQACRHALARELGITPDAETEALLRDLGRTSTAGAGPRRIPLGVLRPPRLAGRADAWARLEAAFAAGRPALVVGAAGIGKSRLIEDFARAHGKAVVAGGRPGDADVPYLSHARLLHRVLEQDPDLEIDPWMIPALDRVLPGRFGDVPEVREDAASRARFASAHTEVLMRASSSVRVVVIDNLHLLDAQSLEIALRLLSTNVENRGPWPIAAVRADALGDKTGEVGRALESVLGEGVVERIDLVPLDEPAVSELLDAVGVEGLAERAGEIHRVSAGSPLYVVEILKHIFASPVDEARADALPAFETVLSRRLEALPPLSRRLAQALAIATTPLRADALARVTGSDAFEVAEALDALEAAGVVENGAFVHDLVFEAVRATVAPATARLLHARLAVVLEGHGASPATIADHLLAAGERSSAATHLVAAGHEAASRFADAEARRRLEQALGCTDDPRLKLRAWLELESIAARTGQGQVEALDALDRLASQLQDDDAIYEARRRRAQHLVECGRPREAAMLAEEAESIALRLGDSVRAGHAELALGLARLRSGDLNGAFEAFATAEPCPDEGIRVTALNGLGAVDGIRGNLEPAYARHQEALTLARARGDVTAAGRLLNSLAATAERLAWYEEAGRHFAESIELARRTRDPRSEAIATLNAVEIHLRLGRFAQACESLDAGTKLVATLGAPRLEALAQVRSGTLERALGRPEHAVRPLEAALGIYRATEDARNAVVIEFNVAIARAEAGEAGAFTQAVSAAEAIAEAGVDDIAAWAWLELALVTPRAMEARAFAARGVGHKDNPHVRMLAAMARQRAALIEGGAAGPEPELVELVEELRVWEIAWAEAMLSRATAGAPARRHLEAARARLAAQADGLPEPLAKALEARLDEWLAEGMPASRVG